MSNTEHGKRLETWWRSLDVYPRRDGGLQACIELHFESWPEGTSRNDIQREVFEWLKAAGVK
jgi:hypothetical protein